MTSKEIKCIKMMTPPNSTSCIRFIKFLQNFLIYSNLLSPCSGLVVSGFSKRDPPDITAKGFLAQDDFILLVKYKHKTYRLI